MAEPEAALEKAVSDAVRASFLSGLPRTAVDRPLCDAVCLEIPAGSVMYRAGDPPRIGIVVSGLVRVYMRSQKGRQVTIVYARRGDVLGLGLIVVGTTPTDAQAVTDAAVLVLNPQTVRTLGRTEPGVGWAMAEEITRQLMDILDELAGNTFGSIDQRIARHLLDLAARRQRDGTLRAAVSQQELADAVGSVREVVNRVLCRLRADGLSAYCSWRPRRPRTSTALPSSSTAAIPSARIGDCDTVASLSR